MSKIILVTGATDGIGLETARKLVSLGHTVLLHGRNPSKLEAVEQQFDGLSGAGRTERYVADLSVLADVEALAQAIADRHDHIDVLINNAGVFATPDPITPAGLDVRFVVNTIAPYLLTQRLLPLIDAAGRVINLSSAAQSTVNPKALAGEASLSDWEAYSQSKLAITMWSHTMGVSMKNSGPVFIAVNPGSMLGTNMVKQAFGVEGGDVQIGANILVRTALDDEFATASGNYFDNDSGRFASPHPDALNPKKTEEVVRVIEEVVARSS